MTAIALPQAQISALLKSGGWVLHSSRTTGRRVDYNRSVTDVKIVDGTLVFQADNATIEGPKVEAIAFAIDSITWPMNIYVYGTWRVREQRKLKLGGGFHEAEKRGRVMLLEHPANIRSFKDERRAEDAQRRRAMEEKSYIIKTTTEAGHAYSIILRHAQGEFFQLADWNFVVRELFDGMNASGATYVPNTGDGQTACVISTRVLTKLQAQEVWNEFVSRGCPQTPAQ